MQSVIDYFKFKKAPLALHAASPDLRSLLERNKAHHSHLSVTSVHPRKSIVEMEQLGRAFLTLVPPDSILYEGEGEVRVLSFHHEDVGKKEEEEKANRKIATVVGHLSWWCTRGEHPLKIWVHLPKTVKKWPACLPPLESSLEVITEMKGNRPPEGFLGAPWSSLKAVHITVNYWPDNTPTDAFRQLLHLGIHHLKRGCPPLHLAEGLHSLCLNHPNPEVLSMPLPPSLEVLSLIGMDSEDGVETWMTPCTRLKQLTLSIKVIKLPTVTRLVRALPQLRGLEIEFCGLEEEGGRMEALARDFAEALVATPIKTLSLPKGLSEGFPFFHSPHLCKLNLYEVRLKNLDFAAAFPSLQDVSLCLPDSVDDLQPLSSLVYLTRLLLLDGNITDVEPLSSLRQLQELHLGYMKHLRLESLAVLTTLPYLKRLVLEIPHLNDLSILTPCPSLESIGVTGDVPSLAPLASLASLRRVSMVGGKCDLQGVEGAPWTSLNLMFCSPSDYTPIGELPQLEVLGVNYCASFNTVEWLKKCTRLRSLFIGMESLHPDCKDAVRELPCLEVCCIS